MLHDKTYANKAALNTALAEFIANILTQAITQRGEAYIALSGGQTPIGMLEVLRNFPIEWGKVRITLVDERWVNNEDPNSNAYLLHKYLLQGYAKTAYFIPLKNAATTPHEGQIECETLLSQFPEQLDVVVLGMGEDGHTASLFPHAPELETAMHSPQRSAAITPQTAPHLRMTLTAPYLAKSRVVILHIVGVNKHQLLEKFLADHASPYAPIRRLLERTQTEKYVFWTN